MLWDRETGRPLHRAIVWQDRRTAPLMDRLRAAGHERMIRRKTGLLLDPYFSGSKLRWLLDHVPGARKKASAGRIAGGTIDAWLVSKLTRGRRHVTDVSNASRTMLMNLRTGRWDTELCRRLFVPAQILPEIVSSGGQIADTDTGVLGAAVPIAGSSATSRPRSSASSARGRASPSAPTARAAFSSSSRGRGPSRAATAC